MSIVYYPAADLRVQHFIDEEQKTCLESLMLQLLCVFSTLILLSS